MLIKFVSQASSILDPNLSFFIFCGKKCVYTNIILLLFFKNTNQGTYLTGIRLAPWTKRENGDKWVLITLIKIVIYFHEETKKKNKYSEDGQISNQNLRVSIGELSIEILKFWLLIWPSSLYSGKHR